MGPQQDSAVTAFLEPRAWEGCFYDGKWRPASNRFESCSPSTGKLLAHLGTTSKSELAQAIAVAGKAQLNWARQPIAARAEVMRRAAELLALHSEELAGWLVREGGSIRPKAAFEIQSAVDELHHAAGLITHSEGQVISSPDPDRLSFSRRLPIGIVGVITPWNVPLLLAMRSVAPALVLGNAVVLKPDPHTSVSGGIALARLFEMAGLPEGVFCMTPGGAEVGEALVEAPGVRMITFTGSTHVGRRVGELAGRNLKRVALELGGNSPMLVLDDCDIKKAVAAGAFGSFHHQGQICMATSRHIVSRAIADQYVELLVQKARSLAVGDPELSDVALGPLINSRQRDRAHDIVTRSIAAGAEIATGGKYNALFYEPTVLTGVTPGMAAFDDEIFAPVAPIIVAEDDEHALELAAATPYGLAAAIQTGDIGRGLRLARRLRVGMIHINDQTIVDLPQAPMGGMGQSGNGSRFGSLSSWEDFTEWQWLTASSSPALYP
ncbi:aldehyde dehydrogenase family protein [Herbaspirillum lusitanum]|uniref:aldehyde dehydrogenase family protein n=1 Tax=Herbaspirillum lusitanum TaxID=213312 RepID=UPI0002D6C8A8|nr:aldehyde dehydrogenase family protein [Herbaspirillum lusitanum]